MDEVMSGKPRTEKVFAALLVSITAGAIILMALSNNPPSAGPFNLSAYYRLDPVEQAIRSRAAQFPQRWNRIEAYYSGTKAGNIEQLSALAGLANPEDISCHFCICNGLGGDDGQIQATAKWQRQWSIIPGKRWYGTGQTIRICIVADGDTAPATDFQVKRTEALIEVLSRRFDIPAESIYYPAGWR